MKKILFGGNSCKTTIKDCLFSQSNAIAVQIEHGLQNNKSDNEVRKDIIEMFKVEKFNFKINAGEIKDTGSNKIEKRIKNGIEKRVLIKNYRYSIPFEGTSSMLNFRPITFHGQECYAEVIENIHEKLIVADFECEENFQEQFDQCKIQCIGSLTQNAVEANKDIENWNNRINDEIDRIFPIIKKKRQESIDFNKRNNIQ